MDVLSRILVAVDGSPTAHAAVRLALKIGGTRSYSLRFVSIVERNALLAELSLQSLAERRLDPELQSHETACRRTLEIAQAAALANRVEAQTVLRVGQAVDEILAEAAEWNATCIVVGTHGRTGLERTLLGSCAEAVLRRSVTPVLVAREPGDASGSFDRVLCAFDESQSARLAAEAALCFAAERNAELHLLTVVQLDDLYAATYEREGFDPDGTLGAIYKNARWALKSFAARTVGPDVRTVLHVIGGADVAAVIARCVGEFACGLVMIGNHGRRGLDRAVIGSVAETLIRSIAVPVLAFHEPNHVMCRKTSANPGTHDLTH